MIKNTHIFNSKKIDSISKLLATIKNVLLIMNKKFYTRRLEGINSYFIYDYKNKSFVSKNNTIKEEHKENIQTCLEKLENKKRFKNQNKIFVFRIVEEEIYYMGIFYNKNGIYNLYDNSEEHIKEVCNLSNKIKFFKRLKLEKSYIQLYNDFIKEIKEKEIKINTETGIIKHNIKDLLKNNSINLNKKIVYKNKKYKYNSIKLYTMIIENKELIYNNKFEKIKYDIVSILICKELCKFLNGYNNEMCDYTIYDEDNLINYKIVNKFNFEYNIKERELKPPLLPFRI